MFGLGIGELLVILLILLLLFGTRRLPELSRSIGESARELQKGFSDENQQNRQKKSKHKNNKQHKA